MTFNKIFSLEASCNNNGPSRARAEPPIDHLYFVPLFRNHRASFSKTFVHHHHASQYCGPCHPSHCHPAPGRRDDLSLPLFSHCHQRDHSGVLCLQGPGGELLQLQLWGQASTYPGSPVAGWLVLEMPQLQILKDGKAKFILWEESFGSALNSFIYLFMVKQLNLR